MENRCAYIVIFFGYIFSFQMGFSLKPLCLTKRHDKYIFTHLKHQIDFLHDKMGMDVATYNEHVGILLRNNILSEVMVLD